MSEGCVYRCLDPDCNMPTFDMAATTCSHCGNTSLRAGHPGGAFDTARQSFVCCSCGSEYDHKATALLREKAKLGQLDEVAPGMSDLFDLTNH